MKRVNQVYVGTQSANGFVIDPSVIGETEARLRVLVLWQPTSRLRELPDQRWLLTLGERMVIRDVTAPGLTAIMIDDAFTTAPRGDHEEGATPVKLSGWHGGSYLGLEESDLVELDPASWVALPPVRLLEPVAARGVTIRADEAPLAPPVNLGHAAGVATSNEAAAVVAELAATASAVERQAQARRGRRGTSQAVAGRAPSRKRQSLLAKLILKSPARGEVHRRHAKYLDRLTEQFQKGDFDEALRNAIGLGSGPGGPLSLRLPGRRDRLAISGGSASGGGSLPWGSTVYEHLLAMYKKAAQDLENAGRIDEAAFVLAELMRNDNEAVLLFERHKKFEQAASFAESRSMADAVVARLWWLAGHRDRAIRVARRRGAFASVLARLVSTDPEAAHGFRLQWVNHLEVSGNGLAAVEVGWGDEDIRPLLGQLIERGIQRGGQQSIALQAYRVALHPSAGNMAAVAAMLQASETVGDTETVRDFALALAKARPADKAADRELTGRTMRSLLVTSPRADKAFQQAWRTLRDRADPVLRADIPAARQPSLDDIAHLPPQPAGALAVADAAVLSDNLVLVALGEFGCRLMRPDGRVIVHYDVPTHSLVVADHGGSALLLTGRDPVIDIHQLDLATRAVTHYGAIESALWTSSYDGATWVALGERGLIFYDMVKPTPTIVWRELDRDTPCYALARDETRLAAIIMRKVGARQQVQAWGWEHENHQRLVSSSSINYPQADRLLLLSNATSIWQTADHPRAQVIDKSGKVANWIEAGADIEVDGDVVAARINDNVALLDSEGNTFAKLHTNGDQFGVRSHANMATVYDSNGRIMAVDQHARRVVLSMRVTV